jgi:hypothetical protein
VEVREAEGVAVMGVVMVVVGVGVVPLAAKEAERVDGVAVKEKCVARSRCNRCRESSLSTPLQGRHHHRRHCCRMSSSSQRCTQSCTRI